MLADLNLGYSSKEIDLEGWSYDPEAIILTSDKQFSLLGTVHTLERARAAILLERGMVRKVQRVEYCSEGLAIQNLRSGDIDMVITLPIFNKQQIRDLLKGALLQHKVTRHTIPSRPLRLDIPLQILKDSKISLAEAERKLFQLLTQRHVNRKPPGSRVDGRCYEEEVLIFAA
jgi:hypothetical protein